MGPNRGCEASNVLGLVGQKRSRKATLFGCGHQRELRFVDVKMSRGCCLDAACEPILNAVSMSRLAVSLGYLRNLEVPLLKVEDMPMFEV